MTMQNEKLPTLPPYIGEDRRKPEHCANAAEYQRRFDDGADRMDRLEEAMKINTAATLEMLDILAAAKGAFKVLGWLGVAFKWIGIAAGAVTAVVAAWHVVTGGVNPK